jgi:hypothetical protein
VTVPGYGPILVPSSTASIKLEESSAAQFDVQHELINGNFLAVVNSLATTTTPTGLSEQRRSAPRRADASCGTAAIVLQRADPRISPWAPVGDSAALLP